MSAQLTSNCENWIYGDQMPDPAGRDLIGLKARWIADHVPASPTLNVLDFGCGEGKFLALIRQLRPDARLTGVDVIRPHGEVAFDFHHVGPADPLPLENDSFELVISCDVLEHVADITFSLSEVARVMKPGAGFIGFVPIEGGMTPHSFFRLFNSDIFKDTKDHKIAYRRPQLSALFERHFRIVDFEYSYHLLGSFLDASFFASFKAPVIGRKLEQYWRGQENIVYRSDAGNGGTSPLGQVLKLANRMAYCESNMLRRIPITAGGLLFHLQKSVV